MPNQDATKLVVGQELHTYFIEGFNRIVGDVSKKFSFESI